METADKFAWKLMIDGGSVVDGWSYYGESYKIKTKDTLECRSKIVSIGIDWDKTKPLQDDVQQSFNGTFAEDYSYTSVMEGTLILNDGSKYKWGHQMTAKEISNELIKMLIDKIDLDI